MAGTNGIPTDCPAPTAEDRSVSARRLAAALASGCRFVLAAVFLMAAITKITDLHGFADQVLLRSGLPYAIAFVTAAFLPWLELTCAACLVFGKAVREAGLVLAILLVGLVIYSFSHLGEPDCGCWVFPRIGTQTVWWWPPTRNLLLLLCSLPVSWIGKPRTRLD